MKKVLVIFGVIIALALLTGLGIYAWRLSRDVSDMKRQADIKQQQGEEHRARIEAENQKPLEEKKEAEKQARVEEPEKSHRKPQAELPPDPGVHTPPAGEEIPTAKQEDLSGAKDYMRSRIRHSAGRSSGEDFKPSVPSLIP